MLLPSHIVRQGKKNSCNFPSASSGYGSFKSREHEDSSVFLFSDNVEQPFEDENEASAQKKTSEEDRENSDYDHLYTDND